MVDVVVEQLAQALVVQPLDGLDLDPESIEDLARPMARLERHLQRDLPVEPVVPARNTSPMPPPADPFETWYRIVRSSSAGPNGAMG